MAPEHSLLEGCGGFTGFWGFGDSLGADFRAVVAVVSQNWGCNFGGSLSLMGSIMGSLFRETTISAQ